MNLYPVYSFVIHPENNRDRGEGLAIVGAANLTEAVELLGYKNYSHPDTGDSGGKLLPGVHSEQKGILENHFYWE